MNVQTIERTFIDKLFAICDYHLAKTYNRHSRHVYDIHMIWSSGILNKDILGELSNKVAKDRQNNSNGTSSCRPFAKPYEIMDDIINESVYQSDFEEVTSFMIYDNVSYKECIVSLKEICLTSILPNEILDYKIF